MEKWQKGAKAVLSLSGEGKNKYFAKFPERKDWFEKNYPEHFGRSVAKATSSLNKVTAQNVMNAKDAARKISQLRYQKALEMSSERVRSMGERRRESGEGLGGGLESNKDIISHVKQYGSIKAGRLGGSLYENSEKLDEFILPLIGRGLALAGAAALAPAETALGGLAYLGTKTALRGGIIARGANVAKGAKAAKAAAERAAKIETGAKQVGYAVPTVDWLYGSPLANKIGPIVKPIGDKLQSAFSTAYDKSRFGSDPIGGSSSPSTSSMPSSGKDEDEEEKIDYSTSLLDTEVGGKPKTNFYGIREERIATNARALAEKIIATKGLQECMPMPISMMMLRSKLNSKNSENEAEDEPGEYDYEGDMAKSQLRSIAYNSKMLHDMLEDNTNLPEWVQSKITLAEDYIMTAANYMRGELMNEEVEQVDEKYMGFKAVEKAAAEGGARDPAAVAAAIGRKKYGKEKFQAAAAAGKKLGEEVDDVEAVHRSMERTMEKDLPFEPTGTRKPGNVVDKSGAVHTPMSRVRHLARMAAMNAQMMQQKPETAEDLVAQHQALHTLEEKINMRTAEMGDVIKDFQKSDAPQFKGKSKEKRRQMAIAAKLSAERGSRMDEEMTLDQAKKDPRYKTDPAFKAEVDKAEAVAAGFDQSNDLVNPSMLPDTPTIPVGQGFGDDLTSQKKAKATAAKKKMPSSDNYDMVNREALPDAPMKEESTSISDNPYVAAAAGFLHNTSNRLLYGERK